MKCFECNEEFYHWKALFDHISIKHPWRKLGKWADKYRETYEDNDWTRTRRDTWNRQRTQQAYDRHNPKEYDKKDINIVQIALSKGRTMGEVNAFFNLASKFLGIPIKELEEYLK